MTDRPLGDSRRPQGLLDGPPPQGLVQVMASLPRFVVDVRAQRGEDAFRLCRHHSTRRAPSGCMGARSGPFPPIGPTNPLPRSGSPDDKLHFPRRAERPRNTRRKPARCPCPPMLARSSHHRTLPRNRDALTPRPTFPKTTRALPRRQHFTSRARTFLFAGRSVPIL